LNQSVIQGELGNANLPAWMKQLLTQVKVNDVSNTVYVDSAGNLVRETTKVSETTKLTGTISTNESIDYSDYGTPVSITAPPPNQVLSLSQFLNLNHINATD
jgi:hypothetical protein